MKRVLIVCAAVLSAVRVFRGRSCPSCGCPLTAGVCPFADPAVAR